MKCFLDMDGVLVDFIRGACQIHGLPYDDSYPYERGEWDACRKTLMANAGLGEAEFWQPCDRAFWANLDWCKDGLQILDICEQAFGKNYICLLTTPCQTEGCVAGKRDWINQHIPAYSKRILFGESKHLCAHTEAVLVDDREDSIWKFVQAGGWAVTVPRPWNSHHNLPTIESIIWQLRELGCWTG